MSSYVEYSANNSGGHWWLKDEDWQALETAGWRVRWASLENAYDEKGNYERDADGIPKLVPIGEGNSRFGSIVERDDSGVVRYLGALAKEAYKPGAASIREAAAEWERVTGKSALDAGCACCGQPHRFTLYRDGKYIESGPETHHTASW